LPLQCPVGLLFLKQMSDEDVEVQPGLVSVGNGFVTAGFDGDDAPSTGTKHLVV